MYNSADIVGSTIDACISFFDQLDGRTYELILVNDGSSDGSWQVLLERAARYPQVTAVDLLRNYGQHTAVVCGLHHSRGRQVITLDDDLQNPPEEIVHLIAKAAQGHDLIFGRYRQKRHGLVRRLGSAAVNRLNTLVFGKPPNLRLTNFRLIDRSVVDRILQHQTQFPYVNGLAVMCARRPANVVVEHRPRPGGGSTYGPLAVAALMTRILFSYSSAPLRIISVLGFAVSMLSLVLATVFLVRGLFGQTAVTGWASVATMLAFFNGVSLLIMGMLGEYVMRVLHQVSNGARYHVAEVIHGKT